MNPNPISYNRAQDNAERLVRRHHRDLQWAKDRRRQQERELAEARVLLASHPLALARTALIVSGALLLAIGAISWGAVTSGLLGGAAFVAVIVGSVAAAGVLAGLASALLKLRRRRRAARELLHSRDARLTHTQFHIDESVHSFIDARVLVHSAR